MTRKIDTWRFGDKRTGDPALTRLITEYSRKRGLMGVELARAAGLSETTVSRVMSGRRAPSASTLTRLMVALDIPTEEVAHVLGKDAA